MDFFTALVRYEIDLWNTVDNALRREGLISVARLQAVSIISDHSGLGRVNEISEEISITVGAASKVVDRLERDGLAVRSPNPEDRRSSLIALTADGENALRDAAEVRDAVLLAVIDENEGETALAVITALHSRLDKYREEAVA